MKLSKRTILITGGTSGIGLEFARRLSDLGNTVIVTGRDLEKLGSTRHALPRVHCIQSDAANPDDIEKLHAEVLAKFPMLDVLINNAGIMRNLPLAKPRALKDVTKEIDINLSGPIRMVQQFLPHLLNRPEAIIVNITSGLAFIPLPLSPVYSAAKAAMHSFSLSLRAQLGNTNVSVVELAPPGVETPLFRGEFAEEMKNQKAMAVEDLVRIAISGIESGKREIRPGLSNVLMLMSRIAPTFMVAQLAKTGRQS
jgi:uncharacterized oxidoreductase